MKKLTVLFACMIVPSFFMSGCGPEILVGAAVGGAGVFAASKDTIQGETDLSYEDVWDAAQMVAKYRGNINTRNFESGILQYSEGKSKVWVKLERVTDSTTRLKISSRKYKMPNLDLAQQVYTKILEEARASSD